MTSDAPSDAAPPREPDAGAATGKVPSPPAVAEQVFGPRLELAMVYAQLLATDAVQRGALGPREVPRLWDRHLLNCAVLQELVPADITVLDVGSGAGLPGIALALARPDLHVVLLEPMERRAAFLRYVVAVLGLDAEVAHGRAEEQGSLCASVVTARAVAPLHRLVRWCIPLTEPSGRVLAIKGHSVEEEINRDASAVRLAGGVIRRVVCCGMGLIEPPTRVVVVGHAGDKQ